MHAFPEIFAREKRQTELTLIRHSFNANSTCSASSPKAATTSLTPKASKAVKLRRPSTTRHLTIKPATPAATPPTRSVPRAFNLFTVLNQSSPLSTSAPRRSDPTSLVIIPRSANIKVRTQASKPVSKKFIFNLQTDVRATGEFSKTLLRTRNCFSRSLSAKGSSRSSSDSLTLSFTELSHHLGGEPAIDLREGAAVLPHPLSHSMNFEKVFGRPMRQKSKRDALKAFLTNALRVEIYASSHISVAYRPSTSEISVIITGEKAPLSACCMSAVAFSFSASTGGKVLCTASYCPSRTVSNFHIPAHLKAALWSAKDEKKKQDCKLRKNNAKTEVGGLFTNEKLKHVSPSRGDYSSIGRVPVLLQIPSITPVPGPSHISATPLQEVLKRANSRHNTVRTRQTAAEVLQQLSTLLKAE